MKRLIVCCDGTWQQPDQTWQGKDSPTNVVKLASRVAKVDGTTPQVVWYDQGVGTGNLFDKIRGGLTGDGLEQNIAEAYRFLVGNYIPGDELFFFGFSRGAYTARSLAGMIRKCGIVRRDKFQNYGKVMALYRDSQEPDDHGPTQFRADYSVAGTNPIPIKLIGVWDTVGALGIPLTFLSSLTEKRYQFHDTELSGTVQNAYQALAIDERRDLYEPTLWKWKPKNGQTVEQVWFVGTHSNVGGGAVKSGLSEIALDWMIEKASRAGLVFDPAPQALNIDPLGPIDGFERAALWTLVSSDRTIGLNRKAPDPTQSLHLSVLDRWDRDPWYRPPNLAAYLAKKRDERAASSGCPGKYGHISSLLRNLSGWL